MFSKLKAKWGVSGSRFWLIMANFAVTGTTTAWITRKITDWLGADKYSAYWWLLKITILVIGYQILILFFGFIFGQFRFFWTYEKKVLKRLGLPGIGREKAVRLAVFASGRGSNFEKMISHFGSHPQIKISLLVSNNPGAGALEIARKNGISALVVDQNELKEGHRLAADLRNRHIDYIILAGFLKKIPAPMIDAYRGKIINIHPALLPKFGGKGMYGSRVHEAVLAADEKESGITIHLVDEHYDNGDIIFQASCPVEKNDSPSSLAEKIHALEYRHFATETEKFIQKQNRR